jgi:hypothetical protein
MSFLDDIIHITITREDLGLLKTDLSRMLIMGYATDRIDESQEFRTGEISDSTQVAEKFKADSYLYDACMSALSQKTRPSIIIVGYILGQETLLQAYTGVKNLTQDFYCVTATEIPDDENYEQWGALSTVIQTEKRIFSIASGAANNLTPDQASIFKIFSDLKALRTFGIFKNESEDGDPLDYPEVAWPALQLSKPAGSSNWAYKTLNGILPTQLTDNARHNLQGHNANYYISVANQNITYPGTTFGGEYIDIIRNTDWIENNLRIALFNTFRTNEIIPYTNAGITIIKNQIASVLYPAADMGILAKDSIEITVPDITKIPAQDIQARTLNNIQVKAKYQNAILKIGGLNITITY